MSKREEVLKVALAAMIGIIVATSSLSVCAEEEIIDEAFDLDDNTGDEDVAGEAEEEKVPLQVMQVHTDDNFLRAYIKGFGSGEVAEYQIGNIPVEGGSVYPVSQDSNPIKTLIMVDNSVSIPEASRGKIAEAIKGIIKSGTGNQVFRISTFSEEIKYMSDQYSNDLTALENMVDAISYANQETYLTDVLYDVVDDISSSEDNSYLRIIVFSDGVDNKPIGVTRDELNKKLNEKSFPVYTIGVNTGSNADNLEGMFALSRITGCEYCILEDTEVEAITEMISKAADLSVFKVAIPDDIKTGSMLNTKLTLSDGSSIAFKADMPFTIKEAEPEPDPTPAPTPAPEPEKSLKEKIFAFVTGNKTAVLGIVAGLFVIIGGIIFLIIKKRNDSYEGDNASDIDKTTPLEYGKTEILGADTDGKTTQLTPGEKTGKKRYKLKLTTASDNGRTFRCEMENEIKIGRMPDNDIVISDDTCVHGHHCTIECRNNAFYLTDLMNVKNHSSVNGTEIKPGFPQLVVTNSKVTIGRYTYIMAVTEA